MFMLHWVLGVFAIAAAVIIFVMAILSEALTRGPVQEQTRASVAAAAMTDEGRRNAEALYSLGMLGVMRDRWIRIHERALDHYTQGSDTSGWLGAVSRGFRLLMQSLVLAIGAYLAIHGEVTAGAIVAASVLMSRALAPVEQAVANWQQFLGFRKARERLMSTLRDVAQQRQVMPLPPPRANLSVENLIVQLPNVEKPLLQGISFSLAPGEGLGVIGPTGAGKSTLARALAGIIHPTRGHIRLDGASYDQRDPDDLGALIGYVPQDVQLFNGTAAENISRFQPDANPDDIVSAARMANVHDMIVRLPDGYNTPLGDGGARLSAGQRQRIALARALYGNPPIMVLDEPNSALDAEGDAALDAAIRAAMQRGAAVVVIAHRPSALAAIPKILVLTEGRMAALGPRDEIIRNTVVRPIAAPAQAESN
jgi:ATP-binding cassette subfamily C protein